MNYLKLLRLERGLNRKELAQKTGISYPAITNLEAGKVTDMKRTTADALLAFFGEEWGGNWLLTEIPSADWIADMQAEHGEDNDPS